MSCPDCGTEPPLFAASVWLAEHRRHSHQLPRRLECPPCRTGAVASTLVEVRDWHRRHGLCGLTADEGLPRSLRWGRDPWARVH